MSCTDPGDNTVCSLMFFTQTRGLVVYLLYFESLVLLNNDIFVGKPMLLPRSNQAVATL